MYDFRYNLIIHKNMQRFHLIMPMGGNGSRFSNCGFNLPKPLINIYGKPFLYWSTMSILKFNDVADLTFIVLKEHIIKYSIDIVIHQYFPQAKIIELDHVLNGPVLTCLEGIKNIDDDLPLLFNDCDHLFKSSEFNDSCKNGNIGIFDGALITFKSNMPQYSYVAYDNDRIIGTVEKKVVSNDAICGAYLFKNTSLFKQLAKKYLVNCNYREFFLSGMYNELANNNGQIKVYSTDYHIPFGIPEEYEIAVNDKHYVELQ